MAYWRGKTLGQSALKALLRLVPYIARYRWQVVVGFVGFFLARFFEVSTYYGVALGIDAIGALVQEESLPFGLEIWEIVVGIVSGTWSSVSVGITLPKLLGLQPCHYQVKAPVEVEGEYP